MRRSHSLLIVTLLVLATGCTIQPDDAPRTIAQRLNGDSG